MNRSYCKLFLIGLFFSAFTFGLNNLPIAFAQSSFTGTGEGTTESPYLITNCSQLQEMNGDLEAVYSLANNIDCSESATWNDGEGFFPVGESGDDFIGTLIGNGKTISDLTINRPEQGWQGLFGSMTTPAAVSNVTFLNANITGADKVAVLAGYASAVAVENIQVIEATVEGNSSIGGIIGECDETIVENSSSSGTISGAYYRVGGLIGFSSSGVVITDSLNTAAVNAQYRVGGLLGSVNGEVTISGSSNSGVITSNLIDEDSYTGIGGLIGAAWRATITESYNSGLVVTHGGGLYVGGLIGVGGKVLVQESYNSGNINALISSGNDYNGVGGIVGTAISATIVDSYNKGNIEENGDSCPIGGVVAVAFVADIQNVYNSGSVTQLVEEDQLYIGGVVGQVYFSSFIFNEAQNESPFEIERMAKLFTLKDSFNVGTLQSLGSSIVGGLIGALDFDQETVENEAVLENNWWADEVMSGMGRINESGNLPEFEPTVAGQYEKTSLAEVFKTYSHVVYNADPDWDFATTWSNVYEEKGYPVLAFQNIIKPSTPTANPSSKNFTSSVSVSLSATNADKIRYTLDGTVPTCTSGTQFSSAISITSTTTVKAIACSSDLLLNSAVATFVYTKSLATPSNTVVVTQAPTVTDETAKIILDEFTEYLSGEGSAQLLEDEQVIYFMVGTEEHTVTVKEIKDGVVTIVIASTPQTVTFRIGESKEFDIDADGVMDLRVLLKEVVGTKVDMVFTKVVQKVVVSVTPISTTAVPTAVSNGVAINKKTGNVWWIVCGGGILVLGFLLFVIGKPKKKD